MNEVRVLIGENRFVTLYTRDYIDALSGDLLPTGDTLPTASETYRGKVFIEFGGSGVADICYVCLKQADGTYEWKDLLTFRFGP